MDVKLTIFLALICVTKLADGKGEYRGYNVIEIHPESKEQLKFLHQWSINEPLIDFWSEARRLGSSAQIFVPPTIAERVKTDLTNEGIPYTVISEDHGWVVDNNMEDVERSRASAGQAAVKNDEGGDVKASAYDYNVYHPYDEIMTEVDDMLNRCPSGFLCEIYSIGQSLEGRDQKMLRIYKNEANRPVYWVDSLIHAREWLGGAVHQKIVNHILTSYDTDADVKTFLDNGDWHFLFVHNPDGYSYTWTNERLWRKNRLDNSENVPGTTCFGIDLNRNYMHRWRNSGTSTDPCSNTYPGASPNSEVEVQNVQKEILRLKDRLKAFVTVHTAAKMVLTPWGSVLDPGTEEQCEWLPEPHRSNVQRVADAMGKAIEDTHGFHSWDEGSFCDVLYPSGGTTQDFVTATTGVIYSFTPELRDMFNNGTGYSGIFEAPDTEIQPAFEEVWNGFVAMVKTIDEIELEASGSERSSYISCLSLVTSFVLISLIRLF